MEAKEIDNCCVCFSEWLSCEFRLVYLSNAPFSTSDSFDSVSLFMYLVVVVSIRMHVLSIRDSFSVLFPYFFSFIFFLIRLCVISAGTPFFPFRYYETISRSVQSLCANVLMLMVRYLRMYVCVYLTHNCGLSPFIDIFKR